jgi:Ribbon-helix-helix protein, copG family
LCYTPKDVMRETLTIRLTDELAEALRREARESGIPRGELVRQAVAARFRKNSPSVMARYFGAMRGPADLSTNKAYRRSWTKKRG